MTRDDFIRRVRGKAPPSLSEDSLEFAAAHCHGEGRITEQDVIRCISLATWLDQYWAFRLARSTPDGKSLPVLTSDDLVCRLGHWLQQIREGLFHQRHAPFSSKQAAAAWIEETARKPCQLSPDEKASLYQLRCEIRAKLNEWRARTGLDWRETGRPRVLYYEPGEDREASRRFAFPIQIPGRRAPPFARNWRSCSASPSR
jgi:hypothetical protein